MRPQRPPIEKVLKFNMSFHDTVKKNFFSQHQNKVILVLKLLNSRTRKTLKSTVVIFQALETSPASLTSAASATSLASTASKAQFPQKLSYSDGLTITAVGREISFIIPVNKFTIFSSLSTSEVSEA